MSPCIYACSIVYTISSNFPVVPKNHQPPNLKKEKLMKVTMKNPKTGESKEVKVGWSWILFLFSGFFGLPLFLRKLNVWGSIFLVLWVVNLLVPYVVTDDSSFLSIFLGLIFLGLAIFLGIKGNEMTAKNYLESGWVFAEPDSQQTKMAKERWGIKE
jgi:hypothetical protein